MKSLESSAADYACLMNDVFSYQKEIEFEGEVHNAVLVVQAFFTVDYPTALAMVDDLMVSRMRQFRHVAKHEIPVVCEDFGLDDATRDALGSDVRELEDWMAAILNWHRGTRRYAEADLLAGGPGSPFAAGCSLGVRHGGTGAGGAGQPGVRRRLRAWRAGGRPDARTPGGGVRARRGTGRHCRMSGLRHISYSGLSPAPR